MINLNDPTGSVLRLVGYTATSMVMVLDAHAFVTAAQKWELFKPQTWVIINTMQLQGGCAMLLDNLQTLEHIDIRICINHPRCGDVMVELFSPNGIKSVLAETCSLDGGS